MSQASTLWRHPIVIIFVGSLIGLLTFGPRSTMGLFLTPITSEFGWNREVFSFAIALQNLIWGVGQPLAGMLADRFGTTRVLIGGTILHVLGLYLMSISTDPLSLTLSAGLLMGMGIAGSAFFLVLAAFARLLPPKWHGLAFGIGTASGSLGQLLMNPIGQSIIENQGFEFALILLAVLASTVLFLALPFHGKPEAKPGADGKDQSIGGALSEAFATRSYQLLTLGFFVCGFHVAFITVHLPSYIVDIGLSAQYGSYAIALIGLFNIIGAITAGTIGGKLIPHRYLLSSIYFGRALVIGWFLLTPVTAVTVLVFAALMGLLWLSTIPSTQSLVAVMFGPRYMAMLFGVVFLSHQLGSFLGIWLGGYTFDQTGSYDLVWWIGIALGLFAAVVHLPIREEMVARPAT